MSASCAGARSRPSGGGAAASCQKRQKKPWSDCTVASAPPALEVRRTTMWSEGYRLDEVVSSDAAAGRSSS